MTLAPNIFFSSNSEFKYRVSILNKSSNAVRYFEGPLLLPAPLDSLSFLPTGLVPRCCCFSRRASSSSYKISPNTQQQKISQQIRIHSISLIAERTTTTQKQLKAAANYLITISVSWALSEPGSRARFLFLFGFLRFFFFFAPA
jgi:hypothetical protein